MDPNSNQPRPPQPGQIANPQPFTPPRPQPDWQQGLGGIPPQMQPQPPQSPAAVPVPPSAPQLGELPRPMPAAAPPAQQPPAWTPPTPPQPATPRFTPPVPNMGAGMPPASRSHTRLLGVMGIIIVALILLVGGLYLVTHHKKSGSDADNPTTSQSSQSHASGGMTDLANISEATLVPPDTIDGYKARQTGSADIKDYVSDDNSCELILGVTTTAQLPGDTVDAIVKNQLDQIKKSGATVIGPNAGAMLMLKDSNDQSKTYSLPTANYQFSQGNKHAEFHYSAAILKSGSRLVVNRTCVNQNGTVDASKLTALDNKVKDIHILVQQ